MNFYDVNRLIVDQELHDRLYLKTMSCGIQLNIKSRRRDRTLEPARQPVPSETAKCSSLPPSLRRATGLVVQPRDVWEQRLSGGATYCTRKASSCKGMIKYKRVWFSGTYQCLQHNERMKSNHALWTILWPPSELLRWCDVEASNSTDLPALYG